MALRIRGLQLEKAPAYRTAQPSVQSSRRTAQKTANSLAALCFLFAIAFTPFEQIHDKVVPTANVP